MVLENLFDDLDDDSEKLEVYLEDPNERRKDWIKRKEREGYRVDFPGENELFIDIDSARQWSIFKDQLKVFERNFGSVISYKVTPSKSGPPNRHIRVILPFQVNELQRIAFQAVLGSDPVRELLSIARDRQGDEHPTLFLEQP